MSLLSYHCKLVGPRNWFKRLSETEKKYIAKWCSDSASPSNSPPKNRIIGGDLAVPEQFPYAVAITFDDGTTKCGASLITPRHVLTARHCFKHNEAEPIKSFLYIGGVCKELSEGSHGDSCSQIDMIKIEFEFVMIDPISKYEVNDLAIIQLKNSLMDKLVENPKLFGLACLPDNDEPIIPPQVEIAGWEQAFILFFQALFFAIYFLDVFCYYLDLCNLPNVTGVAPWLNLDTPFLTVHYRQSYPKQFPPFKSISQRLSQSYLEKCEKFRANLPSNACQIQPSWAAFLLFSNSNKVVCEASFVTNLHLITTRECIVHNLKKYSQNASLIIKPISSAKQSQVQFIAWSYSHPFAIIQLEQEIEEITPICLLEATIKPYIDPKEKNFRSVSDTFTLFTSTTNESLYYLTFICTWYGYVCAKSLVYVDCSRANNLAFAEKGGELPENSLQRVSLMAQ
uniref:Peptidase S1 domain-containing protein n=1 Tax=Ditylenchus dipsaci TaxID=166011 RepID=A0A915CMK4_9BILA